MGLLHSETHSAICDHASARNIRPCTSSEHTQAQPLLHIKMLDSGSYDLRHPAIPRITLTLHGIVNDDQLAFQPDFTNG